MPKHTSYKLAKVKSLE
jgi:hypothetical protein